MRSRPHARTSISVAAAFMLLFAAGCQVHPIIAPATGGTLTLDDFVVARAGSVGPAVSSIGQDSTTEPLAAKHETSAETITANAGSNGIELGHQSGVLPEESPLPEESALARIPPLPPAEIGEEVIVDSMVGQINGRPVFANEFFEPIDAELRIAAEQQTRARFEEFLARKITERMRVILQNELFLAEAESQLTPQQQQGLLYFLSRVEEDIIAEMGGGSRERTMRELEEQEGIDLQQKVGAERERALLQMIIEKEIRPRVVVSWKDVERAYRREYESFNPPGRVTISKISLDPEQDAEQIEMVKDRLEAGDDFGDIAESAGEPNRGAFASFSIGPGGLQEIDDQNLLELYRRQLAKLNEAGQTTDPFIQELSRGRRIVWLHVDSIEYPEGQSIYEPEVQMWLRNELFLEQLRNAQYRYFMELMSEGTVSDVTEMEERLKAIGRRRYAG